MTALTIKGAWYANEEQTAITLDTEELGHVMRSSADSTPEEWDEALAAEPTPYVPPVEEDETPTLAPLPARKPGSRRSG